MIERYSVGTHICWVEYGVRKYGIVVLEDSEGVIRIGRLRIKEDNAWELG